MVGTHARQQVPGGPPDKRDGGEGLLRHLRSNQWLVLLFMGVLDHKSFPKARVAHPFDM